MYVAVLQLVNASNAGHSQTWIRTEKREENGLPNLRTVGSVKVFRIFANLRAVSLWPFSCTLSLVVLLDGTIESRQAAVMPGE